MTDEKKTRHPLGVRAVAALTMFALSAAPSCRGGGAGDDEAPPRPPGPSGLADPVEDPGGSGILTEPDPDHYVDPSTPVGVVSGGLSIRANGEARYRIPIDVPGGRGGVQPSLSLTYASSDGTRDSGKGWSIGGLSSITRCPGQIPLEYEEMDAFFPAGGPEEIFRNSLEPDPYHTLCLDGRLLYPLRDAYTPGTPLTLGVVGNPRMTVIADFPDGLNYGGSFTVNLPDGTAQTYGAWDADDRVLAGSGQPGPEKPYIRRWPLIEHADRAGNAVTYRYTSSVVGTDVGDITVNHRLEQVEYVGGSIDFMYSEQPIPGDVRPQDRHVAYWRGARSEDSSYLTRVDVSGASGGLRGEYRLEYARSAATEELLLDNVSYCDREGVCLPATRFTYSEWADETTGFQPTGAGPSLRLSPWEQMAMLVGDVNGDGLSDIVYPQNFDRELAVVYALQEGAYSDPYIVPIGDHGALRAIDEDGDGALEVVYLRSVGLASTHLRVETVDLRDPTSASFATATVLAELGDAFLFGGQGYPIDANNCNPNADDPEDYFCSTNHLYDLLAVDLEPGRETELLGCVKAVDWEVADLFAGSDAFWHDLRAIDPSAAVGIAGPDTSLYYPTSVECATGCEDADCEKSRAYHLIDVNGDGQEEFLIGGLGPNDGFGTTEGAPLSDESYHVFGYGFSQVQQPPAAGRLPLDVFQRANEKIFGGPSQDILADVNGDGLTDVLRFEPWEDGVGSADDASQWGDHFENACDTSATLPAFEARLSLFVSRGDGTFVRQGSHDIFDAWSDYCERFKRAVVADLDGDRVDEVYFPDAVSGFSDVVRFFEGGASIDISAGPQLGEVNRAAVDYRPRPIDITGTVSSGFLRMEEDGGSEPYASGYARAGFVDVLETVTDGFGAEMKLEYGSLYDGETFQGLPCPAEHEALAPLRPLVSAVRRSVDDVGGDDVRAVELHRYRGACHDAPNYNFRTFERHEVTTGHEIYATPQYTKRVVSIYDDYGAEFGREIYRAKPTEVIEYEWFPEQGRFRHATRTNTFDYGEGFFDRAVAPDWLSVVPVGILFGDHSTSLVEEFSGSCDLDPDNSSVTGWCEATSGAEIVSDATTVWSNRGSFGLPRLVERRWGDHCSVETIGYENREHTALRRHTEMQLGKIVSTGGGDGALGGVCDVTSPSVAPQRAEMVVERDATTWQVDEVISQPGDPAQELRADLQYVGGLLTGITQTVPGAAGAQGVLDNTRTWTWTYDADELFVETVTNPEGHITEMRWHPDLGVPFLVVDANGVAEETRIDGFGRPVETAVRLGFPGEYLGPPATVQYVAVDPTAAANGEPSPMRVISTDPGGCRAVGGVHVEPEPGASGVGCRRDPSGVHAGDPRAGGGRSACPAFSRGTGRGRPGPDGGDRLRSERPDRRGRARRGRSRSNDLCLRWPDVERDGAGARWRGDDHDGLARWASRAVGRRCRHAHLLLPRGWGGAA